MVDGDSGSCREPLEALGKGSGGCIVLGKPEPLTNERAIEGRRWAARLAAAVVTAEAALDGASGTGAPMRPAVAR